MLIVVQFNIMQASRYPKEGHKTDPKESKRVHFTCNPRSHGSAKAKCDKGRTYGLRAWQAVGILLMLTLKSAAVTVKVRGSECWCCLNLYPPRTDRYLGERWTIVFCPLFFNSNKLRYLQERTEGQRNIETAVALQMTYEHVLVHEFMHVGMFGYKYESKSHASLSTTCPKNS
jgi:hypothetical protein